MKKLYLEMLIATFQAETNSNVEWKILGKTCSGVEKILVKLWKLKIFRKFLSYFEEILVEPQGAWT